MLKMAYDHDSSKEWYVFVETGTYLVWPTLLDMLSRLDPSEKTLLGSPSNLGTDRYLEGSGGLVMSRAALRTFVVEHPDIATTWDQRIEEGYRHGDHALSVAAAELNISLQGAWPMFGAGTPLTTPYGPVTWCQPVIAMPGMSSADMDLMWSFTQGWTDTRPILYRDLFKRYVPLGLPVMRGSWNNECHGTAFGIRDVRVDMARGSVEHCSEACDDFPSCFQFRSRPGECKLYSGFTFGKPTTPQDPFQYTSGWRKDRIDKWLAEHQSCDEVEWVTPSSENVKRSKPHQKLEPGVD